MLFLGLFFASPPNYKPKNSNFMNKKFKEQFVELNEQLNFLNLEIDDPIIRSEKSIEIILKSIKKLKKEFLKEKNISVENEIHFFKYIKPKFSSLLIYHNSILKLESEIPKGGKKVIKKHLKKELKAIKKHFDNNLDFYNYYRKGSTYLDNSYYVRGNHDIKLRHDSHFYETDTSFSTSHEYKVATILANDLLEVYVESKLMEFHKKNIEKKSQPEPKGKMAWTGSKVALIELIYALHSKGIFNNGAIELKEIVTFFEDIFEIELGQFRRTFLEIRDRKTDKTKFINSLSEELLKRMNEADDTF